MHRMDRRFPWTLNFRKKPALITVEKFLVKGISTFLLGLPILTIRNIAYWRNYKESICIKYRNILLLASYLVLMNKCKRWQISPNHILSWQNTNTTENTWFFKCIWQCCVTIRLWENILYHYVFTLFCSNNDVILLK